MIDLFYWTTSNGHKIMILLEEVQIEFKVIPINIGQGDQFKPEFLKISLNNRIPAIVDHSPQDGGSSISVFESGAILFYLADKLGQFIGPDARQRSEVLQWLFWQAAGQGPTTGEYYHYNLYAQEKIPYAIKRYDTELKRLLGVLDERLMDRSFIAGDYSIADIACFPWANSYVIQGHSIDAFPNIARWFEAIKARPAVERAYRQAEAINTSPTVTEQSRAILFGRGARPRR